MNPLSHFKPPFRYDERSQFIYKRDEDLGETAALDVLICGQPNVKHAFGHLVARLLNQEAERLAAESQTECWYCGGCNWKGFEITPAESIEYHKNWHSKRGTKCDGLIRQMESLPGDF